MLTLPVFIIQWIVPVLIIALLHLMLWLHPDKIVRLQLIFKRFKLGLKRKYVTAENSQILSYIERDATSSKNQTVLIVHGFSSSKDSYLEVIRRLPKNLRVIAVDLPGHGDSTVPNDKVDTIKDFTEVVKQFVDIMHLKRFHLIGCSMGASVGALYAAKYPDDLLSFTLVCTGLVGASETSLVRRSYLANRKLILMPETVAQFYHMMSFCVFSKVEMNPVIAAGYLKMHLSRKPFYERVVERFLDNPVLVKEHLSRIRTPTLVLWGRNDQISDVESVEIIMRELPEGIFKRAEILEECGHSISADAPERMTSTLLRFIDSIKQTKRTEI